MAGYSIIIVIYSIGLKMTQVREHENDEMVGLG